MYKMQDKNEIKIDKVVEFIKQILIIKNKHQQELFYRGHSNDRYRLIPSLFRENNLGQQIYSLQENILFKELYMSEYKEFINDKYTLDKLVRMQHYSMPTRLLDLTTNPLIALYFACKSSINIDENIGEVIVFFIDDEYVKYYDSDKVSCIANLSRLSFEEKEAINFNIERERFNQQPVIKKLLNFIREEKPFFEPKIEKTDLKDIICIKGIKNNFRVSSQSGVFLLFGLHANLEEVGNNYIQIKRIKIYNQKKILKELDLLNINESTVFPSIESTAKYISDRLK
ncbi:FRG domain-containing protein [Snodgrassella alvi]|uniref:FRG domain-containing protein n=1 Tax=Snodgrassella alvi TaxID=1196083 RepID=UPI00345F49D4